MITFIVGKRNKSFEAALQKAVLGMEIERRMITDENKMQLFDEIQTPSLFGDKKVFILSGIDEPLDVKEFIFDQGAMIRNAPHDVVITTESLLAADTKKAQTLGEVIKITEPKTVARDVFNPFALANAFATGDKKATWIAYQQALAQSDEVEPLHGMIWWKLKDMVSKKIMTHSQAQQTARKLVAVYHESRRGGIGMKERLEQFFLEM